ncbi:MAG: thioredoxin-disulfide reductase [Oscillospiraceae bacterium]|nr:thioredoxin-disulfide reductase [Oscillospiraceae bacterium]
MSILNMNAESYRKFTQAKQPVMVEFSAPWCVYCRRLAPALESVAEEYRDTLVFGAVNIDDNPELAQSEKIEVVPTLLIYQNGQVLGSIVAPESRAQLVAFIEETLQHREQEANITEHIYDMIVVGGGPGGYTAALYAARAGLDTVILEKLSAGGQMALTEQIDNYPGFEDGIDGFSLGEKMKRGTERFGVETKLAEVLSLDLSGTVKKAETSEGPLFARIIVLATGAGPRELGIEGEQELIGKGVNYCAACDGMFYKNKTVVIAGGGNTAAADALILSRICKKVIVVHRRDTLRATKIYHEPLMKAENVEFRWDSEIIELLHDEKVIGIRLRNVKTGEETTLACDGVFVSIGRKPSSELVKDQVEVDPAGYIIADESTRTNIPGVFAVGDVRTKALRQVVTAVADGATAVHYAEEYLAGGM